MINPSTTMKNFGILVAFILFWLAIAFLIQ